MAIKAGQLKERADYQAYILEMLEKENGYQVRPSTAYDPGYGMDRMDYVEEMRQKGGRRESLDLEEMLRENQALFAGGTISEEAKDAYFQAVMKAYLECKEAAKETYGRKKKTAPDRQ